MDLLIIAAVVFGLLLLSAIALTSPFLRRRLLGPSRFPATIAWVMRMSGRVLSLLRMLRFGAAAKSNISPELTTVLRGTRAEHLVPLRDAFLALDELPTVKRGKEALGLQSVFDVLATPVFRKPSPYTDPKQTPPLFIPGVPARRFYDPAEFDFTARLEEAYPRIRAEMESVLKKQPEKFRTYRGGGGNRHEGWNNYFFFLFGKRNEENIAQCPETMALLNSIPRLEQTMAMFAALNPHAGLPPHTGPFNGILRVHLPLIVPPNCAVTVGDETRKWEEGKVMVFDDSFVHSVRNDSDDVRVVLFFTVYHPAFSDAEVPLISNFNDSWQSLPVTRLWEKMQHDTNESRVVLHTSAAPALHG